MIVAVHTRHLHRALVNINPLAVVPCTGGNWVLFLAVTANVVEFAVLAKVTVPLIPVVLPADGIIG